MAQPRPASPHLGPRGEGATQPITTVELFFDLVYVFAVTQLSHLILGNLTVGGVTRAAFLLLIVWWAWIYFGATAGHSRAVMSTCDDQGASRATPTPTCTYRSSPGSSPRPSATTC
jgi:low temperature requirement A protein (LtrA)